MYKICFNLLIAFFIINSSLCKKFKDEEKPAWAKKSITDYNDADLERLLDQWEEDEEPLEDDELPEHLRPQPKLDFSKIDMSNPENILKLSKKGKTLMTFVNVDPSFSRAKTEEITKIWQSSLWNSHIQAERYLIDDNRAIFMFKDGAQAWEAKDFLIQQEGLEEVVIENKNYPGVHAKSAPSENEEPSKVTINKRSTTEEL